MKIIKQETDTSCGIACLRSILDHFGIEKNEEEILKVHEFFVSNNNTVNPIISLGVTSLKFGLQVTYYGYNPITIRYTDLSKLNGLDKFYVSKTLEFLELKGEQKIEKVNVNKIKQLIDENGFVLVGVRPAFIDNCSPLSFTHKVILDAYTSEGFHVLDPSGKEYVTDFDSFLMAFYGTIPELLVFKKVY